MAYNNIFPMSYPQYSYPIYQQPLPAQPMPLAQQSPQQPAQQPGPAAPASSIIWVQGEAGAKSYLVAPNTTVQLWDSERQTIYIKSADGSGLPSMRILDYAERDQRAQAAPQAAPAAAAVDYVTKSDFEALSGKLNRLRADLDSLTARTKKEEKR